MSQAVFNLMRSYPAMTGLSVLLAVMCVVVVWQNRSITRMEQKLTLCHAEGQALAVSNASLLASLREQNNAVTGLQEASRVKKTAAAKELRARHKESEKYAALAQRVMQMQLSAKDECVKMKVLLRNAFMP